MIKKLSGLSDDRLQYFLDRVREINAHDEVAALIETDKLIWEIWEEDIQSDDEEDEHSDELAIDDDSDDYFELDPITEAEQGAETVRQLLKSGETVSQGRISHLESLRDQAHLRSQWRRITAQDRSRIEAVSAVISQLIREASALCFEHELNHFNTCPLSNINSVMAVLRDLEIAKKLYVERGHQIKPEHEAAFHQILLRCAWMRALKKVSAAKVAEASNQRNKASTLRKEALALLELDWEMVFPGVTLSQEARQQCRPDDATLPF